MKSMLKALQVTTTSTKEKLATIKSAASSMALTAALAVPVHAVDLGGGQAFLEQGIDILAWLVGGVGAVFIAIGLFNFFVGVSNDNASGKSTGLQQLLGGGGILAVGILIGTQLPALLF